MPEDRVITLQLNTIDDLFVAPPVNPFSAREVDILGQAGIDVIQKRVLKQWPGRSHTNYLTVQLPADQVSPTLAQDTTSALRRYCREQIETNRLRRQLTVRHSLRQLVGAFIGIAVALAFIALMVTDPLELLSPFLRGVLIVLALYACSVLSFDALWSLVFDWVPFVQGNIAYRAILGMDVGIEPMAD